MQRNEAAERLAFAISGAGISANDIVQRENYPDEASYYIALGQTGAALEDPRVRQAILNAEQEKRDREFEAARAAERERIRERAEHWILTEEQKDEIQSKAAEQAAREYAAGDLDKNMSIAARQRELVKDMEKKARISCAANEAANQAIRDAWRNPAPEEKTFVDRVINRPVVDDA